MSHLPDDDRSTDESSFTVETGVTRQLEDEYSRATLEVTPKATADRTLLVGFGGHWGLTTTELTPTQARDLGRALERVANHLETPPDDPAATSPATDETSTESHDSSPPSHSEADQQEVDNDE